MNHFNAVSDKSEFLKNVQNAREERAHEKKKEHSAIIVQAHIRGWLGRRRFRRTILEEFDNVINEKNELKPAIQIYHLIRKFFSVWKDVDDLSRFLKLCRYITRSLEDENASRSYIGVFLLKEHSVLWIMQMKRILDKCNIYLKNDAVIKISDSGETQNTMIILLHTMVSLTSTNTWRILRNEKLGALKSSFSNLCKNAIGFLVQQDFYSTLKAILNKNLVLTCGTNKTTLTHASLTAVILLSCRPLIYSDFSDAIVIKFVENILTVPAVIHHARKISPEFLMLFEEDQLLKCLIKFLHGCKKNSETGLSNDDPSMASIMSLNKNNNLLCFTANFTELTSLYLDSFSDKKEQITDLIDTLIFLSLKCQECVTSRRSSNLTQWHPILGWFSQDSFDIDLHECLPLIKHQLRLLWSEQFLKILLEEPLMQILSDSSMISESSSDKKILAEERKNSLKKKAMDLFSDVSFLNVKWKNKEIKCSADTAVMLDKKKTLGSVCRLYYLLINTFVHLHLDILTSLCYQDDILPSLWKYLSKNVCVKSFYRYAASGGSYKDNTIEDNCRILSLFCECMIHYITILDDVEMYEQQVMFSISDFTQLSSFLNNFVYKGIMSELFRKDLENKETEKLFTNTHTLLMTLYLRNCRRPYVTSKTHWIIKDFKLSSFFGDTEKYDRKILFLRSKMPHVIPYSERVHLFKKILFEEKCTLRQQIRQRLDGNFDFNFAASNPSVSIRMIKIRRNHIVEDAFEYFHKLDSVDMKQAFRIKFINAEGLEEAGIDQAGIFKEFIVEVIRKLFDPSLNLFRKTAQGHVYPSTITSLSHTNHLQLVEFAGKMLAKAVYEGIVLDVRLASFFLNQVLGQTQSSVYSYLDDLPSMDEELYRSLMCIKHYQGDVSDLALTFSTNEDLFGTITTRELVPGGKALNVTNENKIIYIHMMAHNQMHTQIKSQTVAFAKGFHSLFTKEILSFFSVPELQLLISGEDQPLDFTQLRLHTQYYGGFHDSHKVIVWLWDILINDFSEQERALFLKFVTSSSRPPVLGFAFLNPPFAIRCVEVSEDEDYGDSVGSVIRGFFTIRRKEPEHRLPTSSTCFNLLKLPNYSRKNVLKDKLRYAITANSGFELS